jgi:Calcineurin-like phosphoesterase
VFSEEVPDVGSDVRYIILSDLHLGAENSILTRLQAGTTLADTHRPSQVLTALVDCLRTIVAANASGEPPTVVVAGDLVELALASGWLSLPVMALLARAFADDGEPFVHEEMLFLPGNHDHHLWELSREQAVERFLRSGAPLAEAPASWHTSSMFPERAPLFEAQMLEDAVHYFRESKRGRVRVVYPDLALTNADGTRAVLVTHGHYMERVATLLSAMSRLFDPSAPPLDDVDLIERENWAWVDFFWGSMGRTTRAGALIEQLYDSLQDQRAIESMLAALAVSATKHANPVLRKVESWGIRRGLGHLVASRLHERERDQTAMPLSDGSRQGLATYLAAMRHTFARQWQGPLPADVTIVTGHTHKPFSEWWEDAAWPAGGMRVFNCGGWVVDHIAPQPLQGGAVVLVSDELDVASLRLCQQLDTPSAWSMSVETVQPTPCGEAFADHLRTLLRPEAAPWATFAAAVDELVSERRTAMQKILEGELKLLRE